MVRNEDVFLVFQPCFWAVLVFVAVRRVGCLFVFILWDSFWDSYDSVVNLSDFFGMNSFASYFFSKILISSNGLSLCFSLFALFVQPVFVCLFTLAFTLLTRDVFLLFSLVVLLFAPFNLLSKTPNLTGYPSRRKRVRKER